MNNVTLVTSVMNRTKIAIEALDNWKKEAKVDKIIVLDWSSSIPFSKVYSDSGVRIIRVVGETNWSLSKAFNFAMTFVETPNVIKMDIDYRLKEELFSHIFNQDNSFWTPNNEFRKKNIGIAGFIAVAKNDFLRINGYDERFFGWGWDDDDLYRRLVSNGVCKKTLGYDLSNILWHQDHPKRMRVSNLDSKNFLETCKKNKGIVNESGDWSLKYTRCKYKMIGPDLYIREQITA
jgi:hypothetical protein